MISIFLKYIDLMDNDLKDDLKKMNKLADGGDFKALVNAVSYYEDFETKEEFNLLVKYCNMLIEQDILEAYVELGHGYSRLVELGESSECGDEKTLYYYNEAIKRGLVEAYIDMGDMYRFSIDEDASIKQLECFKKALENNAEGALVAMGEYYLYNDDFDEALKFFYKARESDKNDMSAESGIKQCLKGIDKKNKLAISVFNNCEKNKNIEEIVLLATCYEEGIGVEYDKDEANRLYKVASDNNNAYAMYKVYDKYKYAELSEREKNEMKELLLKSADLGYAKSQYLIAQQYLYKEKYELALKYFSLSFSQGYHESSLELSEIYKNGYGVEKDFKKYIEYYSIYLQHSKW